MKRSPGTDTTLLHHQFPTTRPTAMMRHAHPAISQLAFSLNGHQDSQEPAPLKLILERRAAVSRTNSRINPKTILIQNISYLPPTGTTPIGRSSTSVVILEVSDAAASIVRIRAAPFATASALP